MPEPVKVKSVIEKIMRKLKKGSAEPIRQCWHTLSDGEIAKHSVPVSIRGGKLTVLVDSSPWLQHLTIKKKDILKKLSQIPLGRRVEEIRFKQGKI